MDAMDVFSLISSLASVILAIVAIWLSIVFYKMSSQMAEGIREASKGISSSVDRLEKLFDRLYADTFSMMRDTVSDMRKHIWPETNQLPDRIDEEAEKKADEKYEILKKDIEHQLSDVLKRQRMADERVNATTRELSDLVERAIVRSREVESKVREESIRAHILRAMRIIHRRKSNITADDIVSRLIPEFSPSNAIAELEKMKSEGLISYSGTRIGPETELSIL